MGYTPDEMLNIFKEYGKEIKYFDVKNLFKGIIDIVIKKKLTIDGLNSGNKLENIIKKACLNKNIKYINEVKKYLFIPSVDLNTGKIYFLYLIMGLVLYLLHKINYL